MEETTLHRRALMLGLAAVVASSSAVLAQQGPPRFSGIIVDVRPLHAKQLGPFAEVIRVALQNELAEAYADRLDGGRAGPRLVVRIDAISLGFYAGRDSGRFGGGGTSTDYLEGEALVIGPRGEVLARHPQLSAVPSNSGGAWYDPASEQRRVVALAAHYAGWLRRSSI